MNDVLVLCYHALSDDWPADLCVRPAAFERQLELLVARGYRGARFTDAVLAPPRGRTLAVTFDDGFRSVLELAAPVLDRLELPATVFVVADFAGEDEGRPLRWSGIDQWHGGPHERELASLSWRELRGLADRGWEIGSHTCSHPRLTLLDEQRLGDELERSRRACEAGLRRACTSIAYPYGAVSAGVAAAARDAGYLAGAALPARLHARRRLEWPRAGVYRNDDLRRFALKVSPLVRIARRASRR
jgi:peptidoglycan/xylan/chitin deacetylase (PgdA/CDA1 family)